jgi:phosphoribosyl 1,2-cyclic phosphodiesterase
LMMPEMDGFELCRKLREHPALGQTKIVVLSGKTYDFDRRRALQLGADGYIVKPAQLNGDFLDALNALLTKSFTLSYWGTRGTLPVPGPDTLRYGGNTSCVSLQAEGEPLLILDAGTGIRRLAKALAAQGNQRLTAKILITHPHWDHINALPFFSPLYVPGNEIEIMGTPHGDTSTFQIISAQMDDVYFPVTIREFGARVFFRDLREESFRIGNYQLETLLLSHPGNCLGYRVSFEGRSVCYVTDNELFPPDSPQHNCEYVERLAAFVRGADVLITDTTYSDEEYASKVGWGHSGVRQVVSLAHQAGVKALHLFHHDPDQDDEAIDGKLRQAREHLQALGSTVTCHAPAEGETLVLPRRSATAH